jgi:hypothetical protein
MSLGGLSKRQDHASFLGVEFMKLPGWFFKVRSRALWLIAPTVVSLFVSSYVIESNYPGEISSVGGPRAPEWMYYWRLSSLLLLLLFSLVSLPRWQSFAGLVCILIFFFSMRGL